ncbi:MAG: right-handed parallel beta-helix repeat-containing protein [Bacteroidota bacterium]|nr:right-handed parallel beta-helix repeat-containing protein [Bacteroidota bacterium]MDP4235074.1 right-handed parallel beta-helix repeat-containing protein [Bacteroidota bacterium]
MSKHTLAFCIILSALSLCRTVRAENDYPIGNPILTEIWVDPSNGSDAPGRGATRALALRSVIRAWALVPKDAPLNNTGYHIMLAPGVYSLDSVPSIFESAFGTSDYPIIFEAADDTGSVVFPSVAVSNCQFVYFLNITILASQESYVSSFRTSDHILLRHCRLSSSDSIAAQYGASLYQCQHIYFEHSEFMRSAGSSIDFYATQYGHVRDCRIHDFGGEGVLLRGGTAYFTIEENTIHDGVMGGITCWASDTTRGLDNMILPWLHYEIYDIKCFNNIIHHTQHSGFSCSGGFNILFAFNTLYQTGMQTALVQLSQAKRACSVDRDFGHELIDSGAWGTWYRYVDRADSDLAPIPNKNIYIYNNLFYNSPDSASAVSHFIVAGPVTPLAFNAVCPRPSLADDNVRIKGNIIWNGKSEALGIDENSGCAASNPTCNASQLYHDNLINAAEPRFIGAAYGNFHPRPGSIVYTISKTVSIPDFSWTGLPPKPQEPAGVISNSIVFDKDSVRRNQSFPIAGAFVISTSSVDGEARSLDDISSFVNYPNPAGIRTTFEFRLAKRERISLDVFDILGSRVATLLTGTVDEGVHQAEWNTSSLPAGKYFCRLETEATTATRQVTIVR